ncbi:PREDICTED: helicase protein MOM1-like isoform X1 [Lupinus angustifolius]|uniref:helicase protein MOM1-like isoform X1 n=1 Tax=Lupinus angustifolius TaxID=3871 RepID=UPI00092F9D9E|nr:PREDICTED: helicase protein MOM1-like isoform X1 [Lupinus angustifolius]
MTRSTLSKKMASSSRNRESERNLKRKEPPPSVEVRTKSTKKITTELATPLVLRRSERTRNLSSTVSQLKKSKQDESEDDEDEERDLEAEAVQIKRKMNARIYKNMFRNPKRDCNPESKKMSKSIQEGGNSSGGKIDEDFEGNPVDHKEVSEDNKAKEISKDNKSEEVSKDNKSEEVSKDNKSEEVSKDVIIPSEEGQGEEVSKGGKIPSEDKKTKEVSKDCILPSEDGKAEEVRTESRLSEPMKYQLENSVTLASKITSNATTHETSGETGRVPSDCREEDTLEMQESRNSILNKSLIKNCVELDKGENSISSKRKETMVDMHSDVSATLVNDDNGNLIADASPSTNTVGTSESCSKRIRPTSLSDLQRNQMKLINNVDQCSSMSEGEKLSPRYKEGKSGDPVERPQSSNDEVRKQQRSLHLLLKPGIAMLCEVLRFPDNVKRMVDNCLEYIMNNRQICTEPVSIFQAFQLSLCWTAAALLKHKLNREDSFMLAKGHLNFHCKIEEVYEIHRMMRKLKKDFLYHTGNCNVSGSPKASESSCRVFSNTGVAPKVESACTDISRSSEVKHLLMRQEEAKKKLKADIERKKADFEIRCRIELAAYLAFSRNDVMRTEKVKVFNSEYNKRIGELKKQHETQLKDLEARQLEERRKFQESSSPHESSSCGPDIATLVPFSSNGDTCNDEISDIPSGEVALAFHKSHSSNGPDEVSTSRQGKPDGTVLTKPVYDCCVETRLNGSKNMVSLNSQSTEERIPSATIISSSNCNNTAQIHEANDDSGSDNAYTLDSPLSIERIASLNSNPPQEHVDSVNAKCMPNCENSAQIYVVGDDHVSNTSNIAATLNLSLTDERTADGTISLLDMEVQAEMPGIVNFTDCPENVTAMNPLLSIEQMSGGLVEVSVSDRDLSRSCGTASPGNSNDANHITLLNQFSSEEQHTDAVPLSISAGQIHDEEPETSHEVVTVSVVDREAPVENPGSVNCTDHPENVTPLNSSAMRQISDGVLSSRPSRASSSCAGPATVSLLNPPSFEQQIPDKDSFKIPDGQTPVMVLETNHVNLVEPLEKMHPLSSVESSLDQDTDREMQNSLLSSPVDIVPANQFNHVSLVMEPPEEVQQQSPSAMFLSSNWDLSNMPFVTGTEHQPTNEDALSSPIPDISTEVPNQAIEQPASYLELNSPMPGGVRTQSSDTRNFSTPSEINQHPLQSATHPASMIVPPLCDDPLVNEIERICKVTEQNMKNHEDMKWQLKSDFEKEYEELRRKYEIKIKEIDVGFQQTRKKLDTDHETVFLNKILAEAFSLKYMEVIAPGASGVQQDASSAQLSCQLSRLQIATHPALVFGPSSCEPPAASLLSSYITTSSQNAVPPAIQATPNTSGIFSSFSPRLPNINSISSPSIPHAGREMRATAPHLQPYRPATAVPSPSLSTVPLGMPIQPAPGNIPVTSSFSHWPATYQSTPHIRHQPVNLGVLPTSNIPAMDLCMGANSQSGINMQNVLQCMSNMASLNQSRFGTSSSSMPPNPAPHQATPSCVVCLSDDDD